VPAISVPVGSDTNGLPIGMQILTKSFAETKLLAFTKSVTEKIITTA
jgi:aspartyl-tRNA(Asn)/glutamyl-tRNA(Gln) amidotransferase subunit A